MLPSSTLVKLVKLATFTHQQNAVVSLVFKTLIWLRSQSHTVQKLADNDNDTRRQPLPKKTALGGKN